MKKPVNVAVTGAAGQISYSLIFRIASGQMLGLDQPVNLYLLEITPSLQTLNGVVMELNDCAFPLVNDIIASDDANVAFKDCDYAVLVGSRPRGPGMERKDLLEANANIFSSQGRALNQHAKREVKVLVVANPANTNALIAQRNAPDINTKQFTAMTRLDHNRAIYLLAEKVGSHNMAIDKIIIWGNHSATQYPDIHHTLVNGKSVIGDIDTHWYQQTYIPQVQKRGEAIIEARGTSSAASAASAVIDHMRDWVLDHSQSWVSMGVYSDGSYGIAKDLIYSFPCVCKNGRWEIVQGLEVNEFSRAKMQKTENELIEEAQLVSNLLI